MRKALGIVFLLLGFTLISYPKVESLYFDRTQAMLVRQFEQLGDTEMLDQLSARSHVSTKDLQEFDGLEGARGVLRIPAIDLEIVIFEGATLEALGRGIGMMEPEKIIGVNNIGLAGHRSVNDGQQFNRLDELRKGDRIEVQTATEHLEFITRESYVVSKSDVSVLAERDQPMLTLITCTPIGEKNPLHRLIVEAELVMKEG